MIADDLAAAVGDRLPDVYVARGEATAIVAREDLLDTLSWLRDLDAVRLDFLSSVTVSDWPDADPRFWVGYDLRSMPERHRFRVKVGLPGTDPHIPSVTGLFPTANWHEREQYDFFGVIFDAHPNLTRMMLPEDWDGHPLRKDEELGGVDTWFTGVRVPPVDRRGMA